MTLYGARTMKRYLNTAAALVMVVSATAACRDSEPVNRIRVSGYVEATEVQVSAEVGGRILELPVAEGDRLDAGALLARLDPTDIELTLQRVRAERQMADAQLRLLLAGARTEDIRQADAQRGSAEADLAAARRDLAAADRDLERGGQRQLRNSGALCRWLRNEHPVHPARAPGHKRIPDAEQHPPLGGLNLRRWVRRRNRWTRGDQRAQRDRQRDADSRYRHRRSGCERAAAARRWRSGAYQQ